MNVWKNPVATVVFLAAAYVLFFPPMAPGDQAAREVLLREVAGSSIKIEGTVWIDDTPFDLAGCSIVETPAAEVPAAIPGESQFTLTGVQPGKLASRIISGGSATRQIVPQIVCTDKIFRNSFE